MLKKSALFLLLLLGFSLFLTPEIQAENLQKVSIEVFERQECKHCQDQKVFLDLLKNTRDDIQVVFYDIAQAEHRKLWEQVVELEALPKVTPTTLIGDTILQGFDKAETTGKLIERLVDQAKGKQQYTFPTFLAAGGSGKVQQVKDGSCDEESTACLAGTYEPLYVSIPFIGNIDVKLYSLPTLSIILGFIDGFNPCAMWVLVTFLIVLVQVGDRRRMWQIAGLFILAEAVMYYLILTVWMTTWDFVGLDHIVTPIVGLVAIGGGLFFLYEWKTSDGTCQVVGAEKRQKTRSRIKALAEAEMTLLTILGIVGLALSVNIIEFACSIGIPQAFTKILDLNSLSMLMKQFYMGLYILFYMFDDFLVFGIALYSIEKIGLTVKYSKWCNLIGGLLMLLLGALLLFAPEALIL
ncbi:MAG: glutaredoxin [bacterium]|nr:glutaredoxin [bacterium]